jgi:hypothetical protein
MGLGDTWMGIDGWLLVWMREGVFLGCAEAVEVERQISLPMDTPSPDFYACHPQCVLRLAVAVCLRRHQSVVD